MRQEAGKSRKPRDSCVQTKQEISVEPVTQIEIVALSGSRRWEENPERSLGAATGYFSDTVYVAPSNNSLAFSRALRPTLPWARASPPTFQHFP
jgi:hypothetical protein